MAQLMLFALIIIVVLMISYYSTSLRFNTKNTKNTKNALALFLLFLVLLFIAILLSIALFSNFYSFTYGLTILKLVIYLSIVADIVGIITFRMIHKYFVFNKSINSIRWLGLSRSMNTLIKSSTLITAFWISVEVLIKPFPLKNPLSFSMKEFIFIELLLILSFTIKSWKSVITKDRRIALLIQGLERDTSEKFMIAKELEQLISGNYYNLFELSPPFVLKEDIGEFINYITTTPKDKQNLINTLNHPHITLNETIETIRHFFETRRTKGGRITKD